MYKQSTRTNIINLKSKKIGWSKMHQASTYFHYLLTNINYPSKVCLRWGSNPHSLNGNWILSPARLPIPPRRQSITGVAGFEPTHEGVKVPCLTAWLHPYWEERAGTKSHPSLFVGWVKGLEPSTPGTTIRCSPDWAIPTIDLKWYAKRDSNPRPTA